VRGSPLLRAVIAFAALLVLGVPLWRLTKPKAAQPLTAPIRDAAPSAAATLRLEFTRLPRVVNVFHLGKQIWSFSPAQYEVQQALRIPWPPEGVDLRFQIDWPEEPAIAAARIRVTAPDGTEHERCVWSKTMADEIVTFP
jgi:hypothetical protein